MKSPFRKWSLSIAILALSASGALAQDPNPDSPTPGIKSGADSTRVLAVNGSVMGGDFYGGNASNGTPLPTLVNDGPDDSDMGSSARGRWIPTTSVEQYAGTLANWFGLSAADVPYVFPNMGNFPVSSLGFMAP